VYTYGGDDVYRYDRVLYYSDRWQLATVAVSVGARDWPRTTI